MKPPIDPPWLARRSPIVVGLLGLLILPGIAWCQGLGGGMPGGERPTSREEFQRRLILEGGPNYGPVGPAPLIREVRIVGHESAREAESRSHLRTRKDNYLDPEVLQADVHRLTTHGRFRDVKVYPQPVEDGGGVIIATFGPDGPERCSRLPTMRYSPEQLLDELGSSFQLMEAEYESHVTPQGSSQQFVYCRFQRC